MTDRLSLDDMTSDQLDQLYDDLARAETENAELRDALARCPEREPRLRAEAAVERARTLAARWENALAPDHAYARSLYAALDDPQDQP